MPMQNQSLKKTRTVIAVVMFMFAFFNSAYVQLTTPLLSTMIETEGWTNEMLCNLIVTMGNFAQIPAYILCGILGKRMNKKKMAYISVVCFLAGGLLIIPCSFNIYLVLLCRFVVGFGSGILILISTAILPDFFEGKELSSAIGLVLAGSGFWGFVFSNISGYIGGTFGWKTAYLLHLYAMVPLILFAIFIPTHPLVEQKEKEKKVSGKQEKRGINPMVFVYTLAGMIIFMLVQLMWSNTSIWVTGTLGGTVAQAGLASGMLSLFSCIGRLFFGKIYGKLGRYTLHLDMVFLIIGMMIASNASNFGVALVALACVGVAMALAAPAALNRCIEIAPESQETAQAITSIGFALGNFGSTYWKLFVNGLGDGSLNSVFHINMYFTIAVLVIAFVISGVLTLKMRGENYIDCRQ